MLMLKRHENNTKPAAEHCLTSQKKNEENTWVWGMYDASERVLTVFCVQLVRWRRGTARVHPTHAGRAAIDRYGL